MTICDKCGKAAIREQPTFLSPNGNLTLCQRCKDRYDNLMAYYIRSWLTGSIAKPAPSRDGPIQEEPPKPELPTEIIPEDWIIIQSGGIKEIRYNKNKSLDVKFRSGKIYTYVNVPAGIIAGMLATEYRGDYFNREIRRVYKAGPVSDV